MQTPRVFVLTHPSSAVARDFYLHCGWRPAMVMGFTAVGFWVKADSLDDGNEQVMLYPQGTSYAAADDDADDVCELTEDGFKLGGSTTYNRVNNGVTRLIAFPPGHAGPYAATLNDSKIGTEGRHTFGDGSQFDATPQDESDYNWVTRDS